MKITDDIVNLSIDELAGLAHTDILFPKEDHITRQFRYGYMIGYLKGAAEGREDYKELIERLEKTLKEKV